jgi:DNA recombination protein RmuC
MVQNGRVPPATTLLACAAAFAAGVLFTWLLMRAVLARRVAEVSSSCAASLAEHRARLEEAGARTREFTTALSEREAWLDEARQREATLSARVARQEAELAAAADKQQLLERAEVNLRDAFRALASEALQHNSEAVVRLARASLGEVQTRAVADLDQRQQSIAAMVQPIVTTLQQVDEKMGEVEKERIGTNARLDEQIRSLGSGLQALTGQTGDLVKALRQPHVRGHWGELQLRRVVELAGMLDHCDFMEQQTTTTEDGKFRPDLVVRLPGNKRVVVDAKAPLSAYLDGIGADDETRRAKLHDHARQVRDHITRLGSKAYWSQLDATPEFVVLFLPGEAFFSAALQHDPSLLEFGAEQRVVPASPTTLIALLKAVAYGWRQERIAANAEEISALGRELYNRVLAMASHVEDVRKNLERAVDAFNRSVGSLETRVLPAARRFKELGASAGDDIAPVSPVQTVPRTLQASELTSLLDIVDAEPLVHAERVQAAAGRPQPA